jgi:cell division protein FtsI (penicillin-binding protein 3)
MKNQPSSLQEIRFRRLRGVMVLVLVAFVWQLVNFQVIQSDQLNKKSFNLREVVDTIPALRGNIVDADGNILATTVIGHNVTVDQTQVLPFDRKVNGQTQTVSVLQAVHQIADTLKMRPKLVYQAVKGTSRYSIVAKGIDGVAYRNLTKLDIPWIYYENAPKRIYPNGALAGNLLGFMGGEGTALDGLEYSQNACLAGVDGKETYEKGADGIKIPSSTQITVQPKPGGTLVLSVKSDLQFYAQQVMSHAVLSERADWGSAVVVEVKTGKVLAAAEYPSVDPNNPGATKAADRGSRVFQAVFEPGSTLKTITAATAIDVGKATPETHVLAPQTRYVTKQHIAISDSHAHPTQKLTLTGVLRDSSNTGISYIGERVPYSVRAKYWQLFGLGERTAVKFAGEGSGIIHKTAPDDLTVYTSMFGQGMSVTPMQTAFLYQTIANGGVRLSPQLLMGCKQADGTVTQLENPITPVRAIKASTARSTIDMLEKVVETGGIGHTASIPNYRIGGKSGTAQIQQGRGYGVLHAISFIGMAPADSPRFVVAVTIYKPRTISNSLGATPSFKAIMAQLLHMYAIPPSTTKSANIAGDW